MISSKSRIAVMVDIDPPGDQKLVNKYDGDNNDDEELKVGIKK